ncbi:MAG: TetR/AcrR family transcriptional regulator [Acidimicrobiales bacterium]
MVTRAEPSQDRSRRRREALLRAAIELLAAGGARAVTHRAVAARAGLPPASTTYYFDSIQQLTNDALALHVAERVTELEALADAAAEGGESADQIAARFAGKLADRAGAVVIAQYEIYLEAARNPALREPVAEALGAFERLAEGVLALLGARDPAAAAAAMVAVIDGFALHRLARPRPREQEIASLIETMRALFIAQIMDDDERHHWDERLRRPIVATNARASGAGGI